MTTIPLQRSGDRYVVPPGCGAKLLTSTVPGWALSWEPSTRQWTIAVVFGPALMAAIEEQVDEPVVDATVEMIPTVADTVDPFVDDDCCWNCGTPFAHQELTDIYCSAECAEGHKLEVTETTAALTGRPVIRHCCCGQPVRFDNHTDQCAECAWWRTNAERGGAQGPGGDTVDERTGLLNVTTILPVKVPEHPPVVTFRRDATGRYAVTFGFNPEVTGVLKAAVPAAMRRFDYHVKQWNVSADWIGPLTSALCNAGIAVRGLSAVEEAELSWYCLAPMPISKAGHEAYIHGRCVTCTRKPHRPGGIECGSCHCTRVARAHRVRAALAGRGLSWPTATPSIADALRFRFPLWQLEDDQDAGVGMTPDYADAVDAVIAAAREDIEKPPCPICGRRPAKGVPMHVSCRRRLLALLAGKPFSKPVNRAYQAGLCVVCTKLPYEPHRLTCARCACLVQQAHDQFAKGRNPA
jgi:hypothetical protein